MLNIFPILIANVQWRYVIMFMLSLCVLFSVIFNVHINRYTITNYVGGGWIILFKIKLYVLHMPHHNILYMPF